MRKPVQMKDCMGEPLAVGDQVVPVVSIAPLKPCFIRFTPAVVVGRRGRKIGIRFAASDYVKYTKWVWPDSIQKESSWREARCKESTS